MQIFYFWESKKGASFPEYLGLSVDSWRRNIPGAEVICVNHFNLAQYCGGRTDVERLKTFSLPLQSDIAAVAVLAEQSGIFLDADTVVLPGFDTRIDEAEVFERALDHAVCLQHSWTPPEFSALDREAVLRHPSRRRGCCAPRWVHEDT